MKRTRLTALAATILAGLADARAADVPSYPVREWCETVSDTVGGSYVILNGCLDQEEAAARALASMPPIPERIARWCDEVATVGIGSAGSLQIYLGCVEQELEAMERTRHEVANHCRSAGRRSLRCPSGWTEDHARL